MAIKTKVVKITNLSKLRKQDLVDNGLKYLTLRVAKYLAKKGYWERRRGSYWVDELGFMLMGMGIVGRQEEETLNHSGYTFIDTIFLPPGEIHAEDIEWGKSKLDIYNG